MKFFGTERTFKPRGSTGPLFKLKRLVFADPSEYDFQFPNISLPSALSGVGNVCKETIAL